ncbi:hypothetical protein BKA93DRAFT_749852 [Sparassis latifolia]
MSPFLHLLIQGHSPAFISSLPRKVFVLSLLHQLQPCPPVAGHRGHKSNSVTSRASSPPYTRSSTVKIRDPQEHPAEHCGAIETEKDYVLIFPLVPRAPLTKRGLSSLVPPPSVLETGHKRKSVTSRTIPTVQQWPSGEDMCDQDSERHSRIKASVSKNVRFSRHLLVEEYVLRTNMDIKSCHDQIETVTRSRVTTPTVPTFLRGGHRCQEAFEFKIKDPRWAKRYPTEETEKMRAAKVHDGEDSTDTPIKQKTGEDTCDDEKMAQ